MPNTIAYGFVGSEHLFDQRLEEIGTATVYSMIQESVDEWTRQANAMMSILARPTALHKERYYLPGTGTLQPLDEWGNPKPTKPEGYFDVAYPLQGGGDAWGSNRVSRAYMTLEEANRHTQNAIRRDCDWLDRHILTALFDNVAWVFDDERWGNLTVEPLANNDSVTYNFKSGSSAADDHYLNQNATISDANNPYPTMRQELDEHPGNTGPYIAYIAEGLRDTTEALTGFIPLDDPDIQYGSAADLVASPINPGFGDEVLGKVENECWVVLWRALPANYIIMHAQGGGPPLAMRQHEPSELQGFFMENHSPDGNIRETRMIRYAGFGARNRISACVMEVDNASYSIPSGYDAPLYV